MDEHELEKEKREQQRLERLGVASPVCVECGEDDTRCLEGHHIAGKAYDDAEAIVCRNCHRKLSDDQRDHPKVLAKPPHRLECIGHFLLGLADLFRLLAEKLKQFGHELIDTARGMLMPSGQSPA